MARLVRLTMVHVQNRLEPMEQRRAELLRLVDEAGKGGANVVVLPERADHHRTQEAIEATSKGREETRRVVGLTKDSPWMQGLAGLAKKHKMVVVPSIVEVDGEKLWASSPVIGPEGTWLGKYEKTHLAPGEERVFEFGRHLDPIATPFGKLGIFVCYDVHFPEITRVYELKGADILLWQTMKHPRFERDFFNVALAARSMMHGLPMGVATFGVDDQMPMRSAWNSVIYDGYGQQVAGGIHPGHALVSGVVDLDVRPLLPAENDRQEERFDLSEYLQKQRRPELYGVITEKRKQN